MADPHHDPIRFRCPTCITRLVAPRQKAGKKQRCPKCQAIIAIPVQSQADTPGEGYALSSRAGAPAAGPPTYIAVICGVCNTRMYAATDQVGTKLVCPDCGTPAIVPPPPVTPAAQAPTTSSAEEYALCDEADATGATSSAADENYVAVYCLLCRTLMQVTAEQIGQEVVCPDCGTKTLVRPPEKYTARKRQADVPAAEDEQYDVSAGEGQPGAGSASQRQYVAVVCSRCGTRLHAELEQVGQELACPDCGERLLVKPPPRPERQIDVMEGADEGYALGAAVQTPDYQFVADWRLVPRGGGEPAGKAVEPGKALEPAERWRAPPPAPRWAMLSGIFTFPLYRGVRSRWLIMSALGCVVPLAVAAAMSIFGVAGDRPFLDYNIGGVGPAIFTIVLFAITGFFTCVWVALMSTDCLAILNDTAAGNDVIENWSEPSFFLDWIGEIFYIVTSVAMAALLAVGVDWLLRRAEWPHLLSIPATVFVSFPIVLLSMLEAGTPLNPLSPAVWRSLFVAWWAWLAFYFEAALICTAVGMIAASGQTLPPVALLIAGASLLVAALFIYFRLLGRLAWCCARAAEKREQRAAKGAAAEMDEE